MKPITTPEQVVIASWRTLTGSAALPVVPAALWEAALEVAQQRNVVALFWHASQGSWREAEMPASVRSTALNLTRQQRIRAHVMLADLLALLDAWQQAGIRAIPLKGMALAHTIYPSPTLRYSDDIDLLVPPQQADEALAILTTLGYRHHPNLPAPDWHHLPPYSHPQRGTTIELHTDMVRRARGQHGGLWSVAAIWQRASQRPLADSLAWQLHPADALVHLALHARHHLFDRPTFLLDAALLWPQIKDVDQLWELARAAGARRAMAHLLEKCRQLALLPPVSTRAPTRPLWLADLLIDWPALTPLPGPLQHGALPKLAELLLMDRWADSWRMASTLVFPPGDFAQTAIGNGYTNRLWRRTRLAGRQLGQLLRKEGGGDGGRGRG